MLPPVAPRAIIELAFDPIARIGDLAVRWETLAVALVVLLALVVAALAGWSTPVDPTRPTDAPGADDGEPDTLRADDLLYIAVATLPGAVVGARLGYALVHLDAYGSNLAQLLDIGQGGLQLSLGVVGGVATGSIVAAMLGAPVGRWLHALTLPVLLALAGGKAAMALGGSGQGQPTEVSWATAYAGPGPWGSLAPALASHPSQLYEAVATLVVALVVVWVLVLGVFPGRRGGAFLFAIGTWAVARALVATTWRDPAVLGELRMDQLISIAIAVAAYALMLVVGGVAVAGGRARTRNRTLGDEAVPGAATSRVPGEPDWPDRPDPAMDSRG